ncbi:unnamed protein product [marine sediment metagenome]|uniref:Uncharacterized protein n=1 Tax=marine sediment metagenome TaxID=412755 RepID=X1RJE6_9ZZZZ
MLYFTEHMKRIIELAEKSLVHAQAGKFKPAADDVIKISFHCNVAMQQLDDMSLMSYQGKDPAERLEGGP